MWLHELEQGRFILDHQDGLGSADDLLFGRASFAARRRAPEAGRKI